MRYFVTGGTGFIGKRLIRKLLTSQDNTVWFLLREESLTKLPALIAFPGVGAIRALPVFGDLLLPGPGVSENDGSGRSHRRRGVVHASLLVRDTTAGIAGFAYRQYGRPLRCWAAGPTPGWRPQGSAGRKPRSSAEREAMLAALNGVFGDFLASSGNALAIPMRLRQQGQALERERSALTQAIGKPSGKLLILVHGLCRSDLQWRRNQHDHGEALTHELGYTPRYLHYNSGRHVSDNGREFSDMLDT